MERRNINFEDFHTRNTGSIGINNLIEENSTGKEDSKILNLIIALQAKRTADVGSAMRKDTMQMHVQTGNKIYSRKKQRCLK